MASYITEAACFLILSRRRPRRLVGATGLDLTDFQWVLVKWLDEFCPIIYPKPTHQLRQRSIIETHPRWVRGGSSLLSSGRASPRRSLLFLLFFFCLFVFFFWFFGCGFFF